MNLSKIVNLFNHENLFPHKQFLLKCIRSCDTLKQLDLLTVFIDKFVMPSFKKEGEETKDVDKKVFQYDIETSKDELHDAIATRQNIIIREDTAMHPEMNVRTKPARPQSNDDKGHEEPPIHSLT
jgi:hypothetical protein